MSSCLTLTQGVDRWCYPHHFTTSQILASQEKLRSLVELIWKPSWSKWSVEEFKKIQLEIAGCRDSPSLFLQCPRTMLEKLEKLTISVMVSGSIWSSGLDMPNVQDLKILDNFLIEVLRMLFVWFVWLPLLPHAFIEDPKFKLFMTMVDRLSTYDLLKQPGSETRATKLWVISQIVFISEYLHTRMTPVQLYNELRWHPLLHEWWLSIHFVEMDDDPIFVG